MSPQVESREWHLIRRPEGRPTPEDVELVELELDQPGDGEVLVDNLVMSVEPSMRGRMDEHTSYAEPYELGEPMQGRVVGRVVTSRSDDLLEGSLVLTDAGWRERAVLPARACTRLSEHGLPHAVHLGSLGITGMTAWVGLERVAGLQDGETVFVSSAAGAVGSTAVQLARSRGAIVLGSAGSQEKVDFVRSLGAAGAFDYHAGPAKEQLRSAMAEAGVDGLDVYFDNVGGEQLEAAIRELNLGARVVLCGMISIYNATEPVPGPQNLIRLIWQRARMEGFLLPDHDDARDQFEQEMVPLLRDGTVTDAVHVTSGGVEAAFDAFLGMLDGDGVGKSVVPLLAGDAEVADIPDSS